MGSTVSKIKFSLIYLFRTEVFKKKFYSIVSEDEMYDNIDNTKPMNREIVAEYLVMDYGDDDLIFVHE